MEWFAILFLEVVDCFQVSQGADFDKGSLGHLQLTGYQKVYFQIQITTNALDYTKTLSLLQKLKYNILINWKLTLKLNMLPKIGLKSW